MTGAAAMLPRQPGPAPPPPPPPSPDSGGGGGLLEFATDGVSALIQDEFGKIMEGIWKAGLWLLRESFGLADTLTRFDLAGQFSGNGGLARIWPAIWGLAIVIALGLFFMQLAGVALRGGHGVWRAVTGPVQFGLALALVLSVITSLIAAADGLTTGLLQLGLGAADFRGVMDSEQTSRVFTETPNLGDTLEEMTRAIVLGVAGVFGVLAAVGFGFEMVIRQAIILVLVVTIPIAAAGLVADSTASWFWRAARWTVAAIVLKPALALVLVIGVNMLAGAQGIAGLLTGCGMLFASIFCPWAVYKLLAFVDPSTGAGSMVREFGARQSAGNEPARDGGSSEATNTARFAEQLGGSSGGGSSPADALATSGSGGDAASGSGTASGVGAGTARGLGAGGASAGGAAGGASGGAASGGAAAAAGTAAAGVGAAAVAGYQLSKGAGEAFGARINQQGAMAGIGHPGPVPTGGGGGGAPVMAGPGSAGQPPEAGGDPPPSAGPGSGPPPDSPPGPTTDSPPDSLPDSPPPGPTPEGETNPDGVPDLGAPPPPPAAMGEPPAGGDVAPEPQPAPDPGPGPGSGQPASPGATSTTSGAPPPPPPPPPAEGPASPAGARGAPAMPQRVPVPGGGRSAPPAGPEPRGDERR